MRKVCSPAASSLPTISGATRITLASTVAVSDRQLTIAPAPLPPPEPVRQVEPVRQPQPLRRGSADYERLEFRPYRDFVVDELAQRGVEVSEVQDMGWGLFVFFKDPDGNGWALQQLPQRPSSAP